MPSLQQQQCILKATPQIQIPNTSENENKEMNFVWSWSLQIQLYSKKTH